MEKKSPWPLLVFTSSDKAASRRIQQAYRPDYLRALRRLSRQRDPGLYLQMLDRAQAFTAQLRPDTYLHLKEQLTTARAFEEANEELVW